MKFHVVSPDAAGQLDCILQKQMLDFMQIVPSEAQADVVLMPLSYPHNFELNPALNHIRKPITFLDFSENGWAWDEKTSNVFGTGMTHRYGHFSAPGWAALDDWIRDHPPLITFKRELPWALKSPRLMPIEHLCYLDIPPVQSKAEFDARPIEACHLWGFSHSCRVLLHAKIFEAMTTMNMGVISELNHLEGYFKNPSPRTMASVFLPWYARHPMPELLALQGKCKVSVSLWGAGKKCFRSAEIVNAVMALPRDELAWSFPWNDSNAVMLRPGHEFEDLEQAARLPDLYERYVAGIENLRNYQANRYIESYVLPAIRAVL